MNNARRKQLSKWLEDIENVKSKLETICSDEDDCFNNIPENLQGSERASNSEEAIEQMNEAISSIEDAICIIEDII